MGIAFWLRWATRDLRSRLVQVVAIAGTVALGAGIYAGLGSTSVWRRLSLDASLREQRVHDVHVAGLDGLSVSRSQMLDAVRLAAGPSLAHVDTRLVADLPIRAGRSGSLPAASEVVGVDVSVADRLDLWHMTGGRPLRAADDDVVLLDDHFAQAHELPSSGTVDIAGTSIRYVGIALEPEYLNPDVTFGATIQGAETRAIIYAPLALVQRLAGRPGQVNDAVLALRAGVKRSNVAAAMSRQLPALLPSLPVTVTARDVDPAIEPLYDEIESEQRIFDVFAILILAGAGFATFNLTRRVVESQRRDIGIAMALGVPPRKIAIRPVVMGAQIALSGAALGLLVGWGIGAWVLGIIRGQSPLPVWVTPWQGGLFLRSAALAVSVPVAGTVYPVWRAVRVAPTEALLPPHLRSRRRVHRSLRRVVLPGSTLAETPLRRLTVAPVRSIMTVLGVALVLAPLFAALGITDSATATIERAAGATSQRDDRLLVSMQAFQSATSPTLGAVTSSPLVARHAYALDTGGYLERGARSIGVSISMVDLSDQLVVPSSVAEKHIAPGGIVISSKAATDLGVVDGGLVKLRRPVQRGIGYRFETTTVPIRAVVPIPYRFVAYMSIDDEPKMGLHGIVNAVTLTPRQGVSLGRLQSATASLPGVAWALPARSVSNTIRRVLALVSNLFVVLQIATGLLAFLVAYNSIKVGTDERARENATMMAFGVGVPRLVAIGVVESLMLGLAAIGAGLAVGYGLFEWILGSVMPAAVPDLAVLPAISGSAYLLTIVIGLVAVSTAPLFVARQLWTMNLPSTLRYVE